MRSKKIRRPSAGPVPGNTAAPVASGTTTTGSTLSVTNGTWTNTPTGFAYQWKANGVSIPGATANTYVLTNSEVGKNMTCTVAASNANGTGFADSNSLGPVTAAAPTNTVAPAISGPANVGSVLSLTSQGTWTGVGNTYAYQWQKGGVNIGGATGSTYTVVSGDLGGNITCVVTATNAGGSASASSNTIGPINAAGSMATPTLAINSALGATPVVLDISDTDYTASWFIQLQVATDSGFTSITQNIVHPPRGDEWAQLDASVGLVSPSGTYYARARFLQDDESSATSVSYVDAGGNTVTFNCDPSPWSNTVTDTITTSAAKLNNTTGANKSRYVNVATPFYQTIHNANVGAYCVTRATLPSANTKFHMEVSLDGWQATGGNSAIYFGFDDGTPNENTTGFLSTVPGQSGGPNGCTFKAVQGATSLTFWRNGVQSNTSVIPTGLTLTVGDIIAIELDTSAKTISMWHVRSGTARQILTAQSISSLIPSTWNYVQGGGAGNGTLATSDSATFNPGSSAYAMTPTTGYNFPYA